VLKVIPKEKNKWSEVGNFPRKGGGSLGSLNYQAFPCQRISHKNFTNLSLSYLLRAQTRKKKNFLCKKKMQSRENN